jgi:hypothetical protein
MLSSINRYINRFDIIPDEYKNIVEIYQNDDFPKEDWLLENCQQEYRFSLRIREEVEYYFIFCFISIIDAIHFKLMWK